MQKKAGSQWSFCKHCSGISCENYHLPSLDEDEEEDAMDEMEVTLDKLTCTEEVDDAYLTTAGRQKYRPAKHQRRSP